MFIGIELSELQDLFKSFLKIHQLFLLDEIDAVGRTWSGIEEMMNGKLFKPTINRNGWV
jgi:hypothetical protein